MSASWKSKSLRVERLESRALMASHIGHWQPSDWDVMDGPDQRGFAEETGEWSKSIRFGGNYDVGRDEYREQVVNRDGHTKRVMNPIEIRTNMEPILLGYVVPVRQINVVFGVFLSTTPKMNTSPERMNGSTPVFPWSHESDVSGGAEDGFAEGESGEKIANFTQVQESDATHPLGVAERQSTPRTLVVSGVDSNRASNNYSGVTNANENPSFFSAGERFTAEVTRARFQSKDDYFAQLGGATVDNEEAKTLRDACLELFSNGLDKDADSEYFRNSKSQNIDEIELTWKYILPSTNTNEWTEVEVLENKQQSLFAVYDASQQGFGGAAQESPGVTRLLKVAADRIDEFRVVDSSLTDARYWAISLAIASAWFGFQQQRVRSRLFENLKSISRLPKYYKKSSDNR